MISRIVRPAAGIDLRSPVLSRSALGKETVTVGTITGESMIASMSLSSDLLKTEPHYKVLSVFCQASVCMFLHTLLLYAMLFFLKVS